MGRSSLFFGVSVEVGTSPRERLVWSGEPLWMPTTYACKRTHFDASEQASFLMPGTAVLERRRQGVISEERWSERTESH